MVAKCLNNVIQADTIVFDAVFPPLIERGQGRKLVRCILRLLYDSQKPAENWKMVCQLTGFVGWGCCENTIPLCTLR